MIKILSGSLLVSAMLLPTQSQAAGMRNERYVPANDQQIEGLFDCWNSSLATGDPLAVVKNYAKDSVLLATVSNVPRDTPEKSGLLYQVP